MKNPTRYPTVTEIARAAGVSRAAVSYALRGRPGVSAATKKRILRIAAKLDYRPDLRIGSLMAHIRRSNLPADREPLAFIWVSTQKHEQFPLYHQFYLKTLLAGASERAGQLGCALSEFWLNEPGMTPVRLAKILRARGITGVVFSPAMHDLAVTLDWTWDWFACAVIGNTEWTPALHRAGHYHYHSMWLTLQRLRDEGYQRPAALLNRSIHERIHGIHMAAFQVNHPVPADAESFVQFALPEDFRALRPWPKSLQPDALIVGWPVYPETAPILHRMAPKAKRVVTLDWHPQGALPGMDVRNDQIAANAVDLVVAQMHRNERGIPAIPTALLLDGAWREEVLGSESTNKAHQQQR